MMADSSADGASLDLDHLPDVVGKDDIDRLLEQADDMYVESLTAGNIRRSVAQFEKRIKRNQEDRIKYSDKPEKWIKSEVDLDEEIKKFTQLAAAPELYTDFIKLGGIPMLVALLSHANTDISIDVLEVLTELTDPDIMRDVEDPEEFIDALMKNQLPDLLVDAIFRINEDESDECSQAVSNAMQIIENLSDTKPYLCFSFAKVPKFIPWILRRIRQGSKVDYNKVYASEILGIILQNAPKSREIMGQKGIDGIDKLLRSLAVYRKKDPTSSEEEELVQNLFDCLCNLMLVPSHQITFGKAQGLELMIRMLKERKFSCRLALKLTNFALNNCAPNCEIFVDKLGIRQMFPLFMYKGISVKRGSSAEKEHDEHCVAILQSLCRHCSGISIARVLNKFTECGFEKLERLLELHEKYYSRVASFKSQRTRSNDDTTENEFAIDDAEQKYLDRCENGLFVLQMIDCIMIRISNMGNSLVTGRLLDLLQTKGILPREIQQVITEYRANLDESASDETASLANLLENFMKSAMP